METDLDTLLTALRVKIDDKSGGSAAAGPGAQALVAGVGKDLHGWAASQVLDQDY
ncbi:hypothetical protein [Streptomyces sp. NPDC058701]|uniref:hypothetical protein n=1 Tax=Streptomyces sp. NPDC058701 TaxID=3346608 RepID=UPI0036498AAE